MSTVGITPADVKDHGRNNLMGARHAIAGYSTAFVVREIVKSVLKEHPEYYRHLATGMGVAAGIAASVCLIPRTPLKKFSNSKAIPLFILQSLFALTISSIFQDTKGLYLICLGSGGYFGDKALIALGAAGGILGAAKSFLNQAT